MFQYTTFLEPASYESCQSTFTKISFCFHPGQAKDVLRPTTLYTPTTTSPFKLSSAFAHSVPVNNNFGIFLKLIAFSLGPSPPDGGGGEFSLLRRILLAVEGGDEPASLQLPLPHHRGQHAECLQGMKDPSTLINQLLSLKGRSGHIF